MADERTPRSGAFLKTTANINIAACPTSIDSVAIPSANYVIFLGSQTTQSENGLYLTGTASGGIVPLTKLTGLDPCRATGAGVVVYVRSGTVNADTFWTLGPTNAVASTAATSLNMLEVDIDDFWVPADGIDYAPAFHRAQEAFRASGSFGKINATRHDVYNFLTPLLFTSPTWLNSNGGRWRAYSGATVLKFSADAVLMCSGVSNGVLSPAGGAQISNATLQGIIPSTQDYYGISHTCQITLDNVEIQNFGGRGHYNRGSTSDDFASINTTTAADFTQPAVGATVPVQFASTAGFVAGTTLRLANGGHYRVVSIADPTHATLHNFGIATDTAYATKNAVPGALVPNGSSVRGVFSNTIGSTFRDIRIFSIGLAGAYVHGDNANTCTYDTVSVSGCGNRQVLGDQYGIYEGSYLGNLYISCDAEGCDYNVPIPGNPTLTAAFIQPNITASSVDIPVKTTTIKVTSTTGVSPGDYLVVGGSGYYEVISIIDSTSLRVNARATTAAVETMSGTPTLTFTTTTITRSSGSWIADNFLSGGTIIVAGSTSNNGAFVVSGISATALTITGGVIEGPVAGCTVTSAIATGNVVAWASFGLFGTGAANRTNWEGCYTESDNPALAGSLNLIVGGRVGNLGQGAGFGAFSGGTQITYPRITPLGSYDTLLELGRVGTEQVMAWSNAVDATGYIMDWRNSTNYWQLTYGGTTSKTAMFWTGPSHAFGGGFIGFNRGLLLSGQRYVLALQSALPSASSAADTYLVGSIVMNADSVGPIGWIVKSRTPDTNTGALVWKPIGGGHDPAVALSDASATINISNTQGASGRHWEAAAGLFTANRTVTIGITNARLGDLIWLVRRDVSANILTVSNGGAGGGSHRLAGNSWQTYYFDGTNWILRLGGVLQSLQSSAQNLAFSATLASLTAQAKTATLTGAAVGDCVVANPRAALPDGVSYAARISATDTVEVKVWNGSGGVANLSSATWDFAIVKA